MRKYLLYCTIFGMMLFIAKPVTAQTRGFGLGFIIGEPTGLSAKLWTSPETAFDFGLGLAVGGDRISFSGKYDNSSRLHFHIDYLWHKFNALSSSGRFPFYYGLGARFNSGGGYDHSFGIRAIGGIAWIPDSTPIDIFIELAPVLQITSAFGFGLDAGFGIRYFFR